MSKRGLVLYAGQAHAFGAEAARSATNSTIEIVMQLIKVKSLSVCRPTTRALSRLIQEDGQSTRRPGTPLTVIPRDCLPTGWLSLTRCVILNSKVVDEDEALAFSGEYQNLRIEKKVLCMKMRHSRINLFQGGTSDKGTTGRDPFHSRRVSSSKVCKQCFAGSSCFFSCELHCNIMPPRMGHALSCQGSFFWVANTLI
jgi:hypothetical protein